MKGKMNKNSIILSLVVGVLAIATLCTGIVVANHRQPVITLSDTAIEMDVTDTYALETEIENPRKDVVWKSADESVATVTDKGVVTALKEGKTEVTVTSGKTTASCSVAVTDSQSAPRIELDYNNVAIGLDYSFTVTPKMMWKGKEVKEEITYAWVLDEGAEDGIASIEQKGNSAVITGLKYGETAFTVSTTYRDTVLVKTIKVCVTDIDVMFDSPNMEMSAGCFQVNLGLVATEKDVTSIVPEIRVYDKEELVANPTFTWSNSDESIAVRDSKTGRISAKKAGVAEITGLYKDSKLLIRVNVYRPEIAINPIYVEAIKNYVISSDKWSKMTVEEVTFSGKEVMMATHKSGKNIQLDKDKLPAIGTSGTLIVQTEKVKYVADSMIVTMAISSEADLNKMASVIKSNKGEGYYALTNNITCKGTYNSGLEVEFNGTFDGCGYNIANMRTADEASSTRGLLGKSLGADGAVKNVSFTNAKHGGQGAFIVTNAAGKMENVYIQIDVTDCSVGVWDSATAVLTCNTFGIFQTKSVIVEYMNPLPADATTGYALWQMHYGYAKHQGLYAIGTEKIADSENDLKAGLKDIYGSYVNYGEFVDAGNDVSTWDTNFWTVTNGIPYPSNLGVRKGTVPKVSLPQYVGTGSTVKLDGLTVCDKVVVNGTMKKYGITVKNGSLVIPKNVPSGLSLSITIQSAFDASKKTTVTTTVLASEVVGINDICAVEIYNAKTFEVDLSSKKNVLNGATLTDITIDGKAVTGVTYHNNKLTLSTSVLGEFGEKVMIAYFKSSSKLYIVNVTVDACTLAIRTEADLNKLGSVINKNNGEGRYVLASDIVCKDTYDSNTTVEFNGTFDGHGYAIYNMTTSDRDGANRGLIGKSLGEKGVIKNISFINAKHSGKGSFIVASAAGKMENLYIQISVSDCSVDTYDSATSVLASSTVGIFNTNNIVVEYKDALPDGVKTGYAVWQLFHGYAKHQNLYVVGENKVAASVDDLKGGLKDKFGAFGNYGEYIKAGIGTDTWDSSFWGFTNGVPYPKHLGTRKGEVPNVTMSQYTGAGSKLEIVGLTVCDNAVLDAASQKLGITLKNSTVTVPKNVPLGTTIKVTVSSAFDSSKAKVLTAKVMSSKSVAVDGIHFAETYGKTTFAIDFGDKASAVAGKEVISATLESKAFKTMSYSNGTLTLDTNSLIGSGEKTVTVLFMGQNELVTVTAKVDVCTMAIRTEADLNNMASVITENKGAGRYVLANDIVCNGTYDSGLTVDFSGTFDGRGYVIYNMTIAAGDRTNRGFVGRGFAGAGVIQNVSFVNAKHSGKGGFIASVASGLIQNVYIQITVSDISEGTYDDATSVLGSATYGVFSTNNVVVEYKEPIPAGASNGYPVWQLFYGYAKHQGLYVVGADKVATVETNLNAGLKDVYQAFATYGEFSEAKADTSKWGSFWKVTNGIPYPARLTPDASMPTASIPEIIAPGTTVAIEGATIYNKVVINKAAKDAGVKVENNKLIVPANVPTGTVIELKVQNAFDTSKAVTVSTKVLANEPVKVEKRQDVEIYNKTTVAINLATVKDNIGNATLYSATLEGKAFGTASYTDGVLTVDTATFATLGDNSVVATFRSDSKLITVTIPLDVCTMVLKTEADLNAMPAVIKENGGDGRYVLANHIVCEGEYDNGGLDVTFIGTFDGQGYAIYNLTTATATANTKRGRGLFGTKFGTGSGLAPSGGTLKNVAFINAKHGGNGGFIADECKGLIENVYVQIDITSYNNEEYQGATSVLGSEVGTPYTVKNVLVEYVNPLSNDATNGYALWRVYEETARYQGLYVVGASKVSAKVEKIGNWGASTYAAYSNYADFQKAGISFDSWKGNFWTVIEGVPYPKKLADEATAVNVSIPETVAVGTTTAITGANLRHKVVLSEAAKNLGVEVKNNKLVVPSSVAVGKDIEFTVQSIFDASKKVTLKTKTTAASQEVQLTEIGWSDFRSNSGSDFEFANGTTCTAVPGAGWERNYTLTKQSDFSNTKFRGDVAFADNTKLHYAGISWVTGLCIKVENGTFKVMGSQDNEIFKTNKNIVLSPSQASNYDLSSFVNTRFTLEIRMEEVTTQKATVTILINGYEVDTLTLETTNYDASSYKLGNMLHVVEGSIQVFDATPELTRITWTDFSYLSNGKKIDVAMSPTYTGEGTLNNTSFEGDIAFAAGSGFRYATGNAWFGLTIQESNGNLVIGGGQGVTITGEQTCQASDYGLDTFTNTRITLRIDLYDVSENRQSAHFRIFINGKQVANEMTFTAANTEHYGIGTQMSFGQGSPELGLNMMVYNAKPKLKKITWTDFSYLSNGKKIDVAMSPTYTGEGTLNNTSFEGDIAFAAGSGFRYATGNAWFGLTIQESNGNLVIGGGQGVTITGEQTCQASDYDLDTFTNKRITLRIDLYDVSENRQSAHFHIFINGKQVGNEMTFTAVNTEHYGIGTQMSFGQGSPELGLGMTVYSVTPSTATTGLVEQTMQKQLKTTSGVQDYSQRMAFVVNTL